MRNLPDVEGVDLTSKEEYNKRLDICDGCENISKLIPSHPEFIGDYNCKICFCYMPFKAAVIDSSCPIGKW